MKNNERMQDKFTQYFRATKSELNEKQPHQTLFQESESMELKQIGVTRQTNLSNYLVSRNSSKTKAKSSMKSLPNKIKPMKQTELFPTKQPEKDIIVPPIPYVEQPIFISPNLIRQKHLFEFRDLIMGEMEQTLTKICQKIVDFTLTQKEKYLIEGESQISYEQLIKFTKFLFYKLLIPSNSTNWDVLYNPETSQDFFDDRNAKYLKFWQKISFHQLKKGKKVKKFKDDDQFIDESQEESAAFSSTGFTELDQDLLYQLKTDSRTQKWKYYILKIFGGSGIGKTSLIKAIAKEMKIEVIETNEFTEKNIFEELFQSLQIESKNNLFKTQVASQEIVSVAKGNLNLDVFSINEKANRKKLILHRQELPKYFTTILQEQKVPMIWISDQDCEKSDQDIQRSKANDLIDHYEFIQHTNLETSIKVFLILTIEENFRNLTRNITLKINQALSYQKLQEIHEQNQFFNSFGINIEDELQLIKKQISESKLMTSLNFSEVVELCFKFQGNIRQTLNWIDFYHKDKQVRFRLLHQLRLIPPDESKEKIYKRIIYQMQNTTDPLQQQILDSVQIDFANNQSLEQYSADLFHQQDQDTINKNRDKRYQGAQEIIFGRVKIIKKYFNPILYQSLKEPDYFTINMLFKQIAFEQFQNADSKIKTRRNQQEKVNQIDIYQGLYQSTIRDLKDYRLFKYFDQLEQSLFRNGKLRKCKRESSL